MVDSWIGGRRDLALIPWYWGYAEGLGKTYLVVLGYDKDTAQQGDDDARHRHESTKYKVHNKACCTLEILMNV